MSLLKYDGRLFHTHIFTNWILVMMNVTALRVCTFNMQVRHTQSTALKTETDDTNTTHTCHVKITKHSTIMADYHLDLCFCLVSVIQDIGVDDEFLKKTFCSLVFIGSSVQAFVWADNFTIYRKRTAHTVLVHYTDQTEMWCNHLCWHESIKASQTITQLCQDQAWLISVITYSATVKREYR